jgi:hypothetical protein
MDIFSHIASRRNRHTIVAVLEVKKEIPGLGTQFSTISEVAMKPVRQVLSVVAVVGAAVGSAVAAPYCSMLTQADVQKITGKQVQDVAKGSSPGAGGRCANYATSDGKLYLGISQLDSASEYNRAVASVPESVYPKREKLTGVGDEAILMKDETGLIRYLVARKGDRGVILFPSGAQGTRAKPDPSDDQLKKLAITALSH